MLQARVHYPFLTRLLIDLFNAGDLHPVEELDIEPDYGYIGRIIYKDGQVRYFKGSNLNYNRHAAAEIIRDKGYTKHFLQRFGYQTPPGKTFLTPLFFRRRKTRLMESGAPINLLDNILTYVENTIHYPCYIKPNDGSQGYDVYRCDDRAALEETVNWFQTAEYEVVLVEAAVPKMPEYRIVVYGDEVICCYGRYPLVITGDGQSTIEALLLRTEEQYTLSGRPPAIDLNDLRITAKLRSHGYTLKTILPAAQTLQIFDSANLSIGGTAADCTDMLHPDWKQFAVELVRKFEVSVCGVDFCCEDITQPDATYAILELNSTPTLSGYAALGEREYQTVRDFYRRIVNNLHSG